MQDSFLEYSLRGARYQACRCLLELSHSHFVTHAMQDSLLAGQFAAILTEVTVVSLTN